MKRFMSMLIWGGFFLLSSGLFAYWRITEPNECIALHLVFAPVGVIFFGFAVGMMGFCFLFVPFFVVYAVVDYFKTRA